ncbi:MAG: hypothetical protein LBR54_02520 [Oscillospiraceae bacterium]|jgi:hypothetical protein|nr:hypothetical protein [Oscillospiraceae bacterium]
MTSLNTVFKNVFGQALAPLGFVKIKGRQPYFVRVVPGGEIIHVITYRNEWCFDSGFKAFDILGGVATVYRQSIDLTWTPSDNVNWFSSNWFFYSQSNPWNDDPESEFRKFRKSIYRFPYLADNEESLLYAVEYSLRISENIILPILDKATTLDACVDYFYRFNLHMSIYDDENLGNDNPNNYCNEGLLLIKTNNKEGVIKALEGYISSIAYQLKRGNGELFRFTQEFYNEELKKLEKLKLEKTFNPKMFTKELAELERRKAANTETLRSYGLDL